MLRCQTNKLEHLSLASSLQDYLIFASKVKLLKVSLIMGRLLALLTNIGQTHKKLIVKNTPAYFKLTGGKV